MIGTKRIETFKYLVSIKVRGWILVVENQMRKPRKENALPLLTRAFKVQQARMQSSKSSNDGSKLRIASKGNRKFKRDQMQLKLK